MFSRRISDGIRQRRNRLSPGELWDKVTAKVSFKGTVSMWSLETCFLHSVTYHLLDLCFGWMGKRDSLSETSDPLSPALNSHPGSTSQLTGAVPKATRWEAALRRVGRKYSSRRNSRTSLLTEGPDITSYWARSQVGLFPDMPCLDKLHVKNTISRNHET